MERLSLNFKGPVQSINSNNYLLVINEYLRHPFVFPCRNTSSSTVIQCLEKLFALTGTPSFIHSDNASSFSSREFTLSRGIASSKSSIYHPVGNEQCEKTVGTVWKTIQLALQTRGLPLSQYENVLHDVLHCIRSLLCVSTNERFSNFERRSCSGKSLPTWLTCNDKAFVKRFVRNSKSDSYVDEIELIHVNPTYASIRYSNGREATVSVRDLSPAHV